MQNYEVFLKEIIEKQGCVYNNDVRDKFKIYYEYLVDYNNKVNLTAITDINEVYAKHFADSVLGVEFIKQNASVCDIGTGAGFPGVVLKIVRPDIKLTLVDSLNKRVEFLNSLLKKLDINDVVVLHSRAEDVLFKQQYLNSFDYVIARAVARLNTLCEYCLPFVKTGGNFIAYKSSDSTEEILKAKKAVEILGGKCQQTINRKLDEQTERSFVIIEKIKNTNNKYPRGQNKPRIKPL